MAWRWERRKENLPTIAVRFWANVSKTPKCWVWAGSCDAHGYGQLTVTTAPYRHTTRKAHRISWALHHDDPGDQFVLHACDNPPCVNPHHLRLGTQQDNADDTVRRGRTARGGLNGHAKLTAEMVGEAKKRCSAGESYASIAREFGVTGTTISRSVRGLRWGHLNS